MARHMPYLGKYACVVILEKAQHIRLTCRWWRHGEWLVVSASIDLPRTYEKCYY